MIEVPDPEKMRELFIADFKALGMTDEEAESAYKFGGSLGTHLRLTREVGEHMEEGICTMCVDHALLVTHREVTNNSHTFLVDYINETLNRAFLEGARQGAKTDDPTVPDYQRTSYTIADMAYNAFVCGREQM